MSNKNNITKLKIFKYSPSGMILPFLLIFAVLGTYLITSSRAATPAPGYVSFVDSDHAVASPGVTLIQDQIDFIGARNVSQLSPGAKLTYTQGVKGAKSVCYYVSVLPLKGGGTTATVEFVGPGNTLTTSLSYDATRSSTYRSFCVGAGRKANPGYNVYNMSPSTGPLVLVYREAISF